MIAIAFSLLPVMAVLLYTMDRIEDWLRDGSPRVRHARGEHLHLRLVHSVGAAATRRHAGRRRAGVRMRNTDVA
ncbi:hypothetical protein [Streptomyces olivaceiscleroticus]|uniref:hypothetical protein n=1 Tax=Streptomyces olivaceiscleroticus TaxID=68245 RepID=UPI0031F91BD3